MPISRFSPRIVDRAILIQQSMDPHATEAPRDCCRDSVLPRLGPTLGGSLLSWVKLARQSMQISSWDPLKQSGRSSSPLACRGTQATQNISIHSCVTAWPGWGGRELEWRKKSLWQA